MATNGSHSGDSLTDHQCSWAIAQIAKGGKTSSVTYCAKTLGCSWDTLHSALENRFAEDYARARDARNRQLLEEIIDIADNTQEGETTKLDAEGKIVEVRKGDMIEHRKLQIDTRKWYLSKVLPKICGTTPDSSDPQGDNKAAHSLAQKIRKYAQAMEALTDGTADSTMDGASASSDTA